MKLQGFVGTGSGKMGASVFSIRSGMQIVRQYQGVVSNPNTTAQVQQRAKLKLSSQVAAALGPVIIGFRNLPAGVSRRNAFVSDIFKRGVITYDPTTNKATMNVASINLTNSNLVGGSTSGISATGSTVTATVYPAPQFRSPGSVVTAVVLRAVPNGGVEYVGTASVMSEATTAITVQTVGPVQAGDRLVVYATYPIQNETYVSYMNAIGEAASGAISLNAVLVAYANSLVFSRSNNFAIAATTARETSGAGKK